MHLSDSPPECPNGTGEWRGSAGEWGFSLWEGRPRRWRGGPWTDWGGPHFVHGRYGRKWGAPHFAEGSPSGARGRTHFAEERPSGVQWTPRGIRGRGWKARQRSSGRQERHSDSRQAPRFSRLSCSKPVQRPWDAREALLGIPHFPLAHFQDAWETASVNPTQQSTRNPLLLALLVLWLVALVVRVEYVWPRSPFGPIGDGASKGYDSCLAFGFSGGAVVIEERHRVKETGWEWEVLPGMPYLLPYQYGSWPIRVYAFPLYLPLLLLLLRRKAR